MKGLRPLVVQLPQRVHEHLLEEAAAAGTCAAEHGAALLRAALARRPELEALFAPAALAAPPAAVPVTVSAEPVATSTGKPTARERRIVLSYASVGHDARAIARLSKIPSAIIRQVLDGRTKKGRP